jgi:cytoskeletal protein RodZ
VTAEDDDQAREEPWHHSTPAVAGASVVALGVIALLVWAVVSLTSNADSPQEAPTQFVDPTFTSSTPTGSTTTTTATITTTGPVITSEIVGPSDTATTSGSDTSTSTDTSSSGSSTRGELPTTRSHAGDTGTSRPRVRTNVTRTLYPAPGN